MLKFTLGFVTGLVVATVGVSGVARMVDRSIDTVKTQANELAKETNTHE